MARGYGRWKSRARGLPEVAGELPVAALAEEIETPGPGAPRALLTIAGNPALSAPNGPRLERALPKLDFMVSVDAFLNVRIAWADIPKVLESTLERHDGTPADTADVVIEADERARSVARDVIDSWAGRNRPT